MPCFDARQTRLVRCRRHFRHRRAVTVSAGVRGAWRLACMADSPLKGSARCSLHSRDSDGCGLACLLVLGGEVPTRRGWLPLNHMSRHMNTARRDPSPTRPPHFPTSHRGLTTCHVPPPPDVRLSCCVASESGQWTMLFLARSALTTSPDGLRRAASTVQPHKIVSLVASAYVGSFFPLGAAPLRVSSPGRACPRCADAGAGAVPVRRCRCW